MKNIDLLCMGCMKLKPDRGICPHCHFNLEQYENEMAKKGLHYLQPGSILNGRYMVGKVLGEGGFGITYIGWNLNLDMPIAIKEYFPNGFVARNANETDTVSVLSGEGKEKFYLKQKERFLDEAKTLGRLENIDAIVSVKDCFAENGTAYIVMEYLDGEDFGKYLRKNGGKLPARQVFDMMEPIIKALALIHKDNNGLIHRDISPDNIKITTDGKVKLMDFGAARETDDEKSLSVVLKPGYAPEEQYRTRGKQGPWTDVYGLCATMYRAIVGKKPIESLERIVDDNLETPSELGIPIHPKREKALVKGLAVLAKNRWQSMDELYEAFYSRTIEESFQKLDILNKNFDENSSKNHNKNLSEEQDRIKKEQEELKNQIQQLIEIQRQLEERMQLQERLQKQMQEQLQTKLQIQSELEKENEKKEKAEEQSKEKQEPIAPYIVAINAGYESTWNTGYGVESSTLKGKYFDILEYELNLMIALKLKEELEKRDYKVIMVRENNENVKAVAERLNVAEEENVNLFLTLHCGSCSGLSTGGARVLVSDNKFVGKSNKLAELILERYCTMTNRNRRGNITTNLAENKSEKMPSVILELGCLGNQEDESYMLNEENQKIMAEGIAYGIDRYRYYSK